MSNVKEKLADLLKAAAYDGWGEQPVADVDGSDARDALGYDGNDGWLEDYPKFKIVQKESGGSRRWSEWITIVVEDEEGNFWSYGYDRGLTENQDNSWDSSADSLTQVVKREKTVVVTEYVNV